MTKQHNNFHGNQVPQSVNLLSTSNRRNAWRKVAKAGKYKDWMDYQKFILAQVKPVKRYKTDV